MGVSVFKWAWSPFFIDIIGFLLPLSAYIILPSLRCLLFVSSSFAFFLSLYWLTNGKERNPCIFIRDIFCPCPVTSSRVSGSLFPLSIEQSGHSRVPALILVTSRILATLCNTSSLELHPADSQWHSRLGIVDSSVYICPKTGALKSFQLTCMRFVQRHCWN